MPTSTAQKLKIRDGFRLLTIHAPTDFKTQMGSLPKGVMMSSDEKSYHQVHWFVMNKAQLNKEWPRVLKLVKGDVVLWIYYPKGTSKIQTDLSRDRGWEAVLAHNELTWINLISFNETWSTFGARLKTESDLKRAEKPKERPVFDFVDPKTKTVRLPADLAKALDGHEKAKDFFDTLSFTNKKEYIEWIVTAKREETRSERVRGTLERLAKSWKNPRNL